MSPSFETNSTLLVAFFYFERVPDLLGFGPVADRLRLDDGKSTMKPRTSAHYLFRIILTAILGVCVIAVPVGEASAAASSSPLKEIIANGFASVNTIRGYFFCSCLLYTSVRKVGAILMSPVFAVVFFNVVMVVWMIPGIFNPIMASTDLHIGVMLSTFFLSGLLFWFQFIPSAPFRPTLSPFGQAGALLATNLIMTVIAIILSFFTSVPLYNFGAAMLGMGSMPGMSMPVITLNRVADQQIGAAILWVCGDFWCFPALFMAFRRSLVDDNRSDFLSTILRRQQNMSVEEFQRARDERVASLKSSGESGNVPRDE